MQTQLTRPELIHDRDQVQHQIDKLHLAIEEHRRQNIELSHQLAAKRAELSAINDQLSGRHRSNPPAA
jgi:flagellar biosynthesis chaperone FliJ